MAMRSWVTAATLLVLLVPEACSSDSSDDDTAKGGSSAQGGNKASGGAAGQSTAEAGATPVGQGGREEPSAGGSAGSDNGPQGGVEHSEGGAPQVTGSAGENSGSGGHATSSGGANSGGANSGGANSGGANSGGSLSTDAGAGGAGGLDCSTAGAGRALTCEPGSDSGSGWIDGSGNCVGIQGAVYTIKDPGGSDMYFSSVIDHICVAGVAKSAPTIDSQHWGAILSIQLSNHGSPGTYDATAHGFTGMEFTVSGSKIPAKLFAQYRVDGVGSSYCKQVGGAGHQSVLLSEAKFECWDSSNTATPDKTILTHFEIEVPSNTTSDVEFDFCVNGLAALQ